MSQESGNPIVERKHVTIMFTDIVGYTALMGSDEDKAFEILRKNRAIHQELSQKYGGKLIKELGDGMLLSFNVLTVSAGSFATDVSSHLSSYSGTFCGVMLFALLLNVIAVAFLIIVSSLPNAIRFLAHK